MKKKHPKKMKENQKARKAIFDEHIPKQASTLHKNMTSKCDVRNNDVSVTSRLNKENKSTKTQKDFSILLLCFWFLFCVVIVLFFFHLPLFHVFSLIDSFFVCVLLCVCFIPSHSC